MALPKHPRRLSARAARCRLDFAIRVPRKVVYRGSQKNFPKLRDAQRSLARPASDLFLKPRGKVEVSSISLYDFRESL